jgi:hypothetical protein
VIRAAALLAALALVAAPAGGQDVQPKQGRVLKGTIGDTAITACFVEDGSAEGVFYADAALEPIRLEAHGDAGPSDLREMRGYDDPTGAMWSLNLQGGGRIEGAWRKDGETQPIRLAAETVTLPEYGSACETGAFLDPLLAGGTVTSKRESLAGTAYTVIEYTGPQRSGLEDYSYQSLALDPVRPGDNAINAAFAKALPDSTAGGSMGNCFGAGLVRGMGSSEGSALQPLVIAPRWLGLRESGSAFCGGAHPNHYVLTRTYDRDSGAEVDTAAWFLPGALTFYEFDTPQPGERRAVAGLSAALLRAVLAQWPSDDAAFEGAAEHRADCIDFAGERGWQIGLTRAGPVFVPQFPHVAFGCTEEIVLPWAKARPFLSPEGRAVLESLR